MGRLLSGLLLLNLIVACGERLPKGVIPKNELPGLLVEVHLLDANMATLPIDSARMQVLSAYKGLFEYYKIDSAIFVKTIEYYSKRPAEFQEIYTEVNQRLQSLIDADIEVRAAEYRRQVVADSLQSIRMRDSLILVARDSLDLRRKRHLLFNHEADSTFDRQVPVNFMNYSIRLFEDLGLWQLNFEPFVKLDSTLVMDRIKRVETDSIRPLPTRLAPIR